METEARLLKKQQDRNAGRTVQQQQAKSRQHVCAHQGRHNVSLSM
jgi:hypothetical protein